MEIQDLGTLFDFDTFDMTEDEIEVVSSAADALIKSINKFGSVNMPYMSDISGLATSEITDTLAGKVIFQNPLDFSEKDEWNESEGWLISSQYLCGNIPEKLMTAKKVNKKFPCFERNIAALERIIPEKVDSTSIHVSLGATWIPTSVYKDFICDLLSLSNSAVNIIFNRELAVYKIETKSIYEVTYSVLNNYTYGTDDMTAISIIEDTLNSRTVKVYDYDCHYNKKGNYAYTGVLNQTKTIAAQAKQNQIIEAFDEWIHESNKRMERICDLYNEHFVGYTFTPFDGSFLDFSDLNPDISLFPHQKNSVARMLLSGNNLLLAHDVGTGKTYEIICGCHELYRTGLSKKNLIVVPNSVLNAFEASHKLLYPNDKILVIDPRRFTPQKRNSILEEIRDGDYTAVYMAFSSFDLIVMSKQYYIQKKHDKITELRKSASEKTTKYEKKALEREADLRTKALNKYILEEKECPWLCFDDLGIETLFVDEAHNYKNILISTRTSNITGLHTAGSKKAIEMFEKSRFTKRTIMATGTPLSNSLADLFVFQMYLQPDELAFRGVDTLDTWINSFAERESNFEVDVDAKHLKLVTRFSKFHNIPELLGIFSNVCDFYAVNEKKNIPEFKGHTDIKVPRSEWQSLYIEELSARADAIHAGEVERSKDNFLKLTIDGRLCALDIRLADKDLFDDKNPDYTKVDACADKIVEILEKHPDTCQIVFSDIGTPKEGFNVYDELKAKLTQKGILSSRIAFIHDATTDKQKADLFKKMNSGEISVCIGSTSKLGTGVNVQEKLIAIHHLDVPWKPSDLTQREGRILRQGNTCEEVFIYHYVTEGSFDGFSWQILEKKARFLESFLSGVSGARDVDEIDGIVLQYSEIKALAIGNELIKKRFEAANELQRAKLAYRSRQKELFGLHELVSRTPKHIANLDRLIGITEKDITLYKLKKEKVPNDERLSFGEEVCSALGENYMNKTEKLLAFYQCFDIYIPACMEAKKPFVRVRSENGGIYDVEVDLEKPMGCSKRLDYLFEHLDEKLNTYKSRKDTAIRRKIEAEININSGNPYEEIVEKLKAKLDNIDKQIEEKEKAEREAKNDAA